MTRENTTDLFFDIWLVFKRSGSVRMTIREADIARDERKMFLTVRMPKSLWSSPELKGTITVTDDNREPVLQIDAQAASEALRQAIGVDIDLLIHRKDIPETEEP